MFVQLLWTKEFMTFLWYEVFESALKCSVIDPRKSMKISPAKIQTRHLWDTSKMWQFAWLYNPSLHKYLYLGFL